MKLENPEKLNRLMHEANIRIGEMHMLIGCLEESSPELVDFFDDHQEEIIKTMKITGIEDCDNSREILSELDTAEAMGLILATIEVPIPEKMKKAGGVMYSWGHYTSKIFVGFDLEDIIRRGARWGKQEWKRRLKDDEKKGKKK